MSVTATFDLKLEVSEALQLGLDIPSNPTISHSVSGQSGRVTLTKVFSDERTLAAGADNIDLTALPGPYSTTIDMTGLNVQLVKIVADAANVSAITFAIGAANGYRIFGSTACEISLGPGEAALFYYSTTTPEIGATACEIDVSSAEVDAVYKIIIVAG